MKKNVLQAYLYPDDLCTRPQRRKKNYTHVQGAAKEHVTRKTAKIWQNQIIGHSLYLRLLGNVQTAQSYMYFDLDALIKIAM